MKLIRVGQKGQEKPGLISRENEWIDVSSIISDYHANHFDAEIQNKILTLSEHELSKLPRFSKTQRLGAPLLAPSKIICIGLNFSDHAKESNMEEPKEPVVFFKSPSSLSGPNDPIVKPYHATKCDWEVELAVIIAKKCSYLSLDQANEHIFGYCCHNDVSERNFQLERGGQWVKGKSCDTFAPLGPFIATKDEIPNIDQLKLWLNVNDQRVQNGSTSTFIFKVHQIVAYLSHFMTLMPGDIISTGTPPGVGLGMKPPKFLEVGDRITLGIDGLGSSSQLVISDEQHHHIDANCINTILKRS